MQEVTVVVSTEYKEFFNFRENYHHQNYLLYC